jgi:hypothetical protein
VTLFLTVFLAVLAALYVRRELDAHKTARARHREYCHKRSVRYTWMWRIQILAGQDPELYKQQAVYWEKLSKSWVPTSPTQSELDILAEQSQDDEIRLLEKEFDSWEAK